MKVARSVWIGGKVNTYLSISLDHYLSIKNNKDSKLMSTYRGPYDTLNELRLYLGQNTLEYKLNSLKIDAYEHRRKNYWASIPEMLARAFNCYLIDKLREINVRNDYLCYEFKVNKNSKERLIPNPVGEERERINYLFDQFFLELKEKEVIGRLENPHIYSTNLITVDFNISDSEDSFKQLKFMF